MDETLYSEGAGPGTKAVIIVSLLAAAIAGTAWLNYLAAADSTAAPASGRAVSAAISMVVALVVGLASIETFVRRKIILTRSSLQVGRELMPLSRLALPVLAGEQVPESVRSASLLRNALPTGFRALGNLPRAIVGQGTVVVVGSEPREILVVYSWRPHALAHFLRRALEPREEMDRADDWPWHH